MSIRNYFQGKKTAVIIGIGWLCVLIIGGIISGIIKMSSLDRPSMVTVEQGDDGFTLLVDRQPYFIRGMVYQPIPIGSSHTYNFWNDPLESLKTDGTLMMDLGVNTIRFYQPGSNVKETKQFMRTLYRQFGMRSIMGHWLGFWESPNYADPAVQKRLKKEVIDMVEAYKNERALLFWVLGNENNFSFGSMEWNEWAVPELASIEDPRKRQEARARIYYSFVNDLAREIKKRDPYHLIVMGHGELQHVDIAREACPDIDILGVASYRGKGFGNLWRETQRRWRKPIILTEFGCDSFNAFTGEEDEDVQAAFLTAQWKEISDNGSGKTGIGNCLGGFVFEWSDEWWKHNEHSQSNWYIHDQDGEWSNGSYYFDIRAPRNMNMNEEWFGLIKLQKNEPDILDTRIPKKAYYVLKELWEKEK